MPINIEGGLLVDGQEVGAGGLTTYTATVSFTSDTDGLITYDVVPSDDEFLLSMTVNSNTAANAALAGSTLNVVMHKSEITMTIEGETQTMLDYVGVLAVGDLSNKFDILVTLPVGTATSGIIQMKPGSTPHLYLHQLNIYYNSLSSTNYSVSTTFVSTFPKTLRDNLDEFMSTINRDYFVLWAKGYTYEPSTKKYTPIRYIDIRKDTTSTPYNLHIQSKSISLVEPDIDNVDIVVRQSDIGDVITQLF